MMDYKRVIALLVVCSRNVFKNEGGEENNVKFADIVVFQKRFLDWVPRVRHKAMLITSTSCVD